MIFPNDIYSLMNIHSVNCSVNVTFTFVLSIVSQPSAISVHLSFSKWQAANAYFTYDTDKN